MRPSELPRASTVLRFLGALTLAVPLAVLAIIYEGSGARAQAQGQDKLEATIFSYDGKDFTRTKTTLTTDDGKSAVGTTLDHGNPAYKALSQKHSYIGEVTVFGHKYEADYAPLIGSDGKVTGALFVAIPK
jgi:hypothetical protein